MVHLPFQDRVEAGRLLADEIARRRLDRNAVVLALTRGGVPVGFEVADRLQLPLDVIVVRKIGVPWQPELAMGAIADGERILDRWMIGELAISPEEVEEILQRERAEMKHREDIFRQGNPPVGLQGCTALLVDDGLATGSTMLAAVRHVRRLNPGKIIVAVPVSSRDACERLRKEVNELVCLAVPEAFFAVGEWYRDFGQVSDVEVQRLLTESRQQLRKKLERKTAA